MVSKGDVIRKIKRYYLFYGPNEYKLKERTSSLIKAVIAPGGEAFDLDRYDGKRCDIPALINSISTPPVMSPLRVIVLNNAEKLAAARQKELEGVLSRIPEYSVLAMTASKADKRSKLFKKLLAEDRIHSFEFEDFTSAEAAGLVVRFSHDRNTKISPQVADMMVELFGTDPYRLENEIEKLALFIGERDEIEKRDLAFASGFSRVETPYDLPELIFNGQAGSALELTGRALSSGISEMQILYILNNYLSRMNTAYNSKDVRELLSVHRMPYEVAKRIFARSKKTRPEIILKGITCIFRAEYSLKSARFPSRAIIELLVMALVLAVAGNKTTS